MDFSTILGKKQWFFVILAGLFITNAVTAELISNKLIEIPLAFQVGGMKIGPFVTIVGILPWPVVFLLTDLINEFYGPKVIRKLSWITAGLIFYCFLVVGLSGRTDILGFSILPILSTACLFFTLESVETV